MLKGYKILTVTHKKTKLNKLGHFLLNEQDDALQQKLEAIKSTFNIEEVMYLATCNRVLFFCHSLQDFSPAFVQQFFQQINPDLSSKELNEHVDVYQQAEAIEHLFEVAASVDSMVIGEREILHQLRTAFKQSKAWGLTGDNLRLAFKFAVQFAKEIYAETKIGEKPVSVVSLAVKKLLQSELPKSSRILLIGAGQTNTLAGKFLKKYEFSNVTVFNRTLTKAASIAKNLQGSAFELQDLPTYTKGFDAIIICTGSQTAILDEALYTSLLNGETSEKLVIDLAIPNNVEQAVVSNNKINYIEIEDLRNMASENLAFREREVGKVRIRLSKHLEDFQHIYHGRLIERAMHAVPKEIKTIKDHAMDKVFKKELQGLDENTLDLVERMLDYMEKRCISIPMQVAKKVAQQD